MSSAQKPTVDVMKQRVYAHLAGQGVVGAAADAEYKKMIMQAAAEQKQKREKEARDKEARDKETRDKETREKEERTSTQQEKRVQELKKLTSVALETREKQEPTSTQREKRVQELKKQTSVALAKESVSKSARKDGRSSQPSKGESERRPNVLEVVSAFQARSSATLTNEKKTFQQSTPGNRKARVSKAIIYRHPRHTLNTD